MLIELKILHRRLMDSAGDMWLENNAYYFANKDKMNFDDENPTPEYEQYREKNERENLLFKAAERVENAIAVLEETGLAS